MVAAAELGWGAAGHTAGGFVAAGHGAGCLADGLGERHEVVGGGRRRFKLTLVPDQVPAAGGSQPTGMPLAQIVGMGLRERGKRTDDGGGVRIDIGQRGHGRLRTTVARATPG